VACRRVADQAALRRFACVDGAVVPDQERRVASRGAYACDDACAAEATRRRAWQRAFRTAVTAGPAV
jgi:predicted RNA-binding protein YlxR (DUF448 family)